MKTTTDQIREAIAAAKLEFMKIPAEVASKKVSADTWSKNEVLGHLIDSAANNHQRVVRAAQNEALDFPPYNQILWVEVQRYNEMNWLDLVDLFVLNNLHLCRVIDGLPPEVFDHLCNVGKEKPSTLDFVVTDYLRHLRLHIAQILES